MTRMDAPHVDWSSAEVHEDTLTVEIAGDRPRGWKRSFELVARLLGSDGSFHDVSLRRGRASVRGATPGEEDELRFFLEAVVLQANADHKVDDGDEDEDEPDAPEAHDDPQSEMTDRFRGFAAEENDEPDQP
jgi:hypothetical protein